MSESARSSTSGLLLAFLAGAVTGAVVALLTTPRSGRETRERFGDLARDAAGRVGRGRPDFAGAYTRAAEAARRAFHESLEAGRADAGASPGGPSSH